MSTIKEKEYAQRRVRVAQSLKQNSMAIISSATAKIRSNDTEYPYRQNSNFYYLTGFKEDNSVLIICRGKKAVASYLFVQKKDKTFELWNGARLGVKSAKKSFKHDDVFPSDDFEKQLALMVKKHANVYYDFTVSDSFVTSLREKTKHLYAHHNIAFIIGKERLIKSDAEIGLIKKALSITKEAHHYAKDHARELKNESELQAGVEYIFKKHGSYSDAYTSIVACGNSANTLHYINNDKKLVDGELILMDAGCEYEYYASDITRTFPVNGKFSPAQKELYEMVLGVEKEIIAMVRPDILRSKLQEKSEKLLCQGLVNLGILKGDVKKLLKKQKHKKYYPHGIGHWMGIDVHDEAPYRDENAKEIPLMAGMVMTIEPGIYIDKDDKKVPKRFRGIGIRVEDDILVTYDGYENLSKDIAKEIDEIEGVYP